jgi:ribonuclease G
MIDEILINTAIEGPRIALLSDGVLQEVILEAPRRRSLLGNVYLGRVRRALPGMQAAFIDIGHARAAFMSAREARTLAASHQAAADDGGEKPFDAPLPPINDCVHEGQAVLVQVIKGPVGDKGARVTASVGLAGRNLVLIPARTTDAYSRRIADEDEKVRLGSMMADLRAAGSIGSEGAFILRTAALGASAEEIAEDAAGLQKVWRHLPSPDAPGQKVPSLLYEDQAPVTRAIRDNLNDRVRRVLFDDPETLALAKGYVARVMPALADRLVLYTGPGLLFDQYEIDVEIDQLAEVRVALPSGGWITVESTEALTAVDVNSGSYVDPAGIENTSLVTNLEAVAEAARQLRLRRIGGIVVIDLIHMERADSAETVLDTLSESDCDGGGRIKSVDAIAHDVLRGIEREAHARPVDGVVASVAPEVAAFFDGEGASLVHMASERCGCPVLVRRADYPRGRFEISAEQ